PPHCSTLFPYTTLFRSLSMPTIQPAELWMESHRWERYGKELLRVKDRHERDFVYAPTAEEVITDTVRRRIDEIAFVAVFNAQQRSEEHTSELQSRSDLV